MDQKHKLVSLRARLAEREKRVRSSSEGMQTLFERLGGQDQGKLTALWKSWEQVMGEELACLGYPLGHKERVLTIGADDSMALQELSLQAAEILDRANAFMGSEYFENVRVLLMQGKEALAGSKSSEKNTPLLELQPADDPFNEITSLGAHIGKLDPDSPITRCYETFVALYRKKRS